MVIERSKYMFERTLAVKRANGGCKQTEKVSECCVGTESGICSFVLGTYTLKEAVPPQGKDPYLEAIFVPGQHAQTSIIKCWDFSVQTN